MTFKVANVTIASAVASAGTFTVNYPAGTSGGDYATYGHSYQAVGLQAKFSVDDGDAVWERIVRGILHEWIIHELDEGFMVDGVRVRDPHAGGK